MPLRRVVLRDESVIVFDHTGEYYRIAHYRRRSSKSELAHISAAKFDDLVRRGLLPAGYHTSWTRVTVTDTDLKRGIELAFQSSRSSLDADEVIRYLRNLPWGRELP